MRPLSWKRFDAGAARGRAVAARARRAWMGRAGADRGGSHEELFEIPPGTSARRIAGEDLEILPQTIRLTLGLNDVLVLKNSDTAPHIFGPTLIMPGQSFRLPFTTGVDLQLPVHRACQRAAQRDRRAGARAGLGKAPLALAQADRNVATLLPCCPPATFRARPRGNVSSTPSRRGFEVVKSARCRKTPAGAGERVRISRQQADAGRAAGAPDRAADRGLVDRRRAAATARSSRRRGRSPPAPGRSRRTARLWEHIEASLFRVEMGFGLAFLVAVPLGLWMGWVSGAFYTLNPLFQMLRPISPIAWIPVAILWFGVGDFSPIFLIFISSVFPMMVQTTVGVRTIDRRYLRAAANFGVSRWVLFRRVVIPAVLPEIIVGMRIGLGVAWLVVVAAEMIALNSGLGYLIMDSRNAGNRYDLVIASMIIIGVIGLLLDGATRLLERLNTVKWRYVR